MKPVTGGLAVLDGRTVPLPSWKAAALDPAVEAAAQVLADFARLVMAADLPEEAVPATRFQP